MRTFAALLLLLPPPARALEFARHVPAEWRRAVERDLDDFCRLDHGREEFGRGRGRGLSKRALEGMAREFFGFDVSDCRDFRAFLEGRIDLVVSRFGEDDLVVLGPDGEFNEGFRRGVVTFTAAGGGSRGRRFATHLGLAPRITMDFLTKRFPSGGADVFFGYADDAGRPALPRSALAGPVPGVVLVTGRFLLSPFHPDPYRADSPANGLFRLAILAHEALHDDPRLLHRPCPGDGGNNCDAVPHGSYGLGALVLLYGQGACGACSEEERTGLRGRAQSWLNLLEPDARNMFYRRLVGL